MHGFLTWYSNNVCVRDLRLGTILVFGHCTYVYHSSRKLVIIGDGACGKTSLLSVFTLGYFPTVS